MAAETAVVMAVAATVVETVAATVAAITTTDFPLDTSYRHIPGMSGDFFCPGPSDSF
jgi:hypothetical protein